MTTRLIPPPSGPNTITVNGRTYSCASGATIDVPDWDADVMRANGWLRAAAGVGATAARPARPIKEQMFHDTSLGYTIVWDGRTWRNPATGGAV